MAGTYVVVACIILRPSLDEKVFVRGQGLEGGESRQPAPWKKKRPRLLLLPPASGRASKTSVRTCPVCIPGTKKDYLAATIEAIMFHGDLPSDLRWDDILSLYNACDISAIDELQKHVQSFCRTIRQQDYNGLFILLTDIGEEDQVFLPRCRYWRLDQDGCKANTGAFIFNAEQCLRVYTHDKLLQLYQCCQQQQCYTVLFFPSCFPRHCRAMCLDIDDRTECEDGPIETASGITVREIAMRATMRKEIQDANGVTHHILP